MPKKQKSPSQLIDSRIKELKDWRGKVLSEIRAIITKADSGIIEEWKWEVPAWSCAGIICTGETYKKAVKLTFAKGASLKDPDKFLILLSKVTRGAPLILKRGKKSMQRP